MDLLMDHVDRREAARVPTREESPVRPGRPFVVAAAVITLALLAAHVGIRLLEVTVDVPRDVVNAFDVAREENLPSFFNTILLVLLAASAWLVAGFDRPGRVGPAGGRGGWTAVGLVAMLMAADESLNLHERIFLPVGAVLADLGLRTGSYLWILPGALVALVGVVVFVRWSVALPRPVQREFLVAFVVYGTGALGVEAVSGWIDKSRGIGRLYHMVTAVEEGLEMIGVILAIRATLGMVGWARRESDAGRALVLRQDLSRG